MSYLAACHPVHFLLDTGREVVTFLLFTMKSFPVEKFVFGCLDQLGETRPLRHANLSPVECLRVHRHEENLRVVEKYSVVEAGVEIYDQIILWVLYLFLNDSSLASSKFNILKQTVPFYVECSYSFLVFKESLQQNLISRKGSFFKAIIELINV